MPVMFFRTPFPVNPGADEMPLIHAAAPFSLLSELTRHVSGLYPAQHHLGAIDLVREYQYLRWARLDGDPEVRERSRNWFLQATESNHVLTYAFPRNAWTSQRGALRDSLERIWEEEGWPGSYRDHSLQFSTAWEKLTGRDLPLLVASIHGPWVRLREGHYSFSPSLLGHVRTFVKVEV